MAGPNGTSVLDAFQRSDGPLAGPYWAYPGWPGYVQPAISSQALAGVNDPSAYWTPSYRAPLEVWADVTNFGSNTQLYIASGMNSSLSGYYLNYAASGTITIGTVVAGTETQHGSGTGTGTYVGLSLIAGTIAGWMSSDGVSWTQACSFTDSTYSQNLQIAFASNGTPTITSFGGGPTGMLITNQTDSDYWFGPMHLPAGVGKTLWMDDTSDTSLYLIRDDVADAVSALVSSGMITVSSTAPEYPRATGVPGLLHGDGSPNGRIYASQASLYMRRDCTGSSSSLYVKTSGVDSCTGWTAMNVTTQVVATTVAGLGTGPDGATGLLQLGSSPYDFLLMVYDAAYGKWVSAAEQIATGWEVPAGNPGTSWYDLANPVIMEWSQYQAAGLNLQAKFVIDGRDTSNNQNNTQARIVTGYFASGDAPPVNTTAYGETNIGIMFYLASVAGEVPWTDVTPANDTFLTIEFQSSNQDSNNHSYVFSGTGYIRWTS